VGIDRVEVGGVSVAQELYNFINDEVLPGTGVEPSAYWDSLGAIAHELAPKNKTLLTKREDLQTKIDEWHRENRGMFNDMDVYENFLRDIGYLVGEGPAFSVETNNVDDEIANIAGPQLVVPVMNARYALNAANSRWGSLYDALYGTDAISEEGGATKGAGYNTLRNSWATRVRKLVLIIYCW